MLLVQARKKRDAEIFRKPPKQSDYAAAWAAAQKNDPATAPTPAGSGRLAKFLSRFPTLGRALRLHLQPYFRRAWSLRDTRFFKRVN
jgi:hypothetical protein